MCSEHQTFSQFYLISWSNADYFCLFLQQLFGASLKIDGRWRKQRDGFHSHQHSFALLLKCTGGIKAIQPARGNVSSCHPATSFPTFTSLGGKKTGQGKSLRWTCRQAPYMENLVALGCLYGHRMFLKLSSINPGQSIACWQQIKTSRGTYTSGMTTGPQENEGDVQLPQSHLLLCGTSLS